MTPLGRRRRTRFLAPVAGGVLVLSALVAPSAALGTAESPYATANVTPAATGVRASAKVVSTRVIGRSVQGRKIVARLYGNPSATRVAVLIGSMHGSELGGIPIVKRVERRGAPANTALWVVRNLNPDGAARGTRKNAHGVDLNRNGPHLWSGKNRGSEYTPGPYAASEPETRAYTSFLDSVDPDVVLIYHQAGNAIDSYQQKSRGLTRGLARRMHLRVSPFDCSGVCTGTLTGWFNANHAGTALTVELPRPVSQLLVRRGANAARWAASYVPDR